MEKQELKYLLRNLKRYEKNIESLYLEVEVLRTQAMKITPTYSGEPGGGGVSSKVEDNVIKYEDKLLKIKALEDKVKYAKKCLNQLKAYQRYIVVSCLVYHAPIKQMAFKEHTSPGNISKIIDNALNKISE